MWTLKSEPGRIWGVIRLVRPPLAMGLRDQKSTYTQQLSNRQHVVVKLLSSYWTAVLMLSNDRLEKSITESMHNLELSITSMGDGRWDDMGAVVWVVGVVLNYSVEVAVEVALQGWSDRVYYAGMHQHSRLWLLQSQSAEIWGPCFKRRYTVKFEYNTHSCIIRAPNLDGKIVGNVSLAVQYAPVVRHLIQTCSLM